MAHAGAIQATRGPTPRKTARSPSVQMMSRTDSFHDGTEPRHLEEVPIYVEACLGY